MLLHIGATTPAGVALTVTIIFLLIFAMSFAFGSVPEGGRRFSREWTMGWVRASLPRMAIAGAFALAVLIGALAYGGNSGTSAAISCDKSLPPLTGGTVTGDRLNNAILSLNQMADAADTGDSQKTSTIWFTSDAHNLTHDIDAPLRQKDADAARKLCEEVIALENQMAGQIDTGKVAGQARLVADSLGKARALLGEVSAGSTPVIVTPCDQPVGAVTNQPLTSQRLQSAIDSLRRASSLAASGDKAGAETAFSGDTHNVTHDVDGPLRTADSQMAIDLCDAVVAIELHLGDKYDPQVMETEAAKSADLIESGGRMLGILK